MEHRADIANNQVKLDIHQARSLVPLKDMSEAHLTVLLEGARADYLYPGQTLFNRGAVDQCHLYLLFGDLMLEDERGEETLIKGRTTLTPIAHSRPRQYQATAASDCAILRIESERLDKLLTWSQVADYKHSVISRDRDLDEDVEWMMRVLHSNLFFKVPPLNVEEIFNKMTPRVVDAGEVVIRQGELGDMCYFLKEGDAQVTRQGSTGSEFIAEIGEGRCFGEDALVNDAPRNANVTMSTDGVLMCLPKQDFYRLLKAPTVPRISMAQLAERDGNRSAIVDVRSDEEYAQGHLPGAVNIPLHLLGIKSRLLRLGVQYTCYCNTGRRSEAATHLLREQGFEVTALADCDSLIDVADSEATLESATNYVLRDGVSVAGQ